jgi:hypothetical protein
MFKPVSSEKFWESPAGATYAAQYLPGDIQRLCGPYGVDEPTLRHGIARWQTANYDETTGYSTLYRGVDNVRLRAADASGLITSRCVEVFGDPDTASAARAIAETATGSMPTHVAKALSGVVEESYAKIAHFTDEQRADVHLKYRVASFEKVARLAEGNADEATKALLLRTAAHLAIAARPGPAAYLDASRLASTDECPDLSGLATVEEITNISIHTTTNPAIGRRFAKNDDGGVLRIDFEPGALSVAPEHGYLDGAYRTMGMGYHYREEEWYGIGQLVAGERVHITALPKDYAAAS